METFTFDSTFGVYEAVVLPMSAFAASEATLPTVRPDASILYVVEITGFAI
jgi:hypothetical protein